MASRPKFSPHACTSNQQTQPTLSFASSTELASQWIPLIECPANFPEKLFDTAVAQLIHHPEYNSTLILRSETISDSCEFFPPLVPELDRFHKSQCIHRKLLPRRPGRDASLEQYCTLYKANSTSPHTVLILTPITSEKDPLPYYHPRVSHLAFRYLPQPYSNTETPEGVIRIEVIPLPDTPLDQDSRIYRTCLALLDTLHRYGWGAMTNYQKRVMHDVLIPREHYQDLYLIMRERHKGLVDTWQEVTDPLKHVFEDIGIATYLMLLWKISFGNDDSNELNLSTEEPWKTWPRPPAGFVDIGCGNGLLTHILTSEGYDGHGIDVRERTSWKSYSSSTQQRLHVYAFNPLDSPLDSSFFPTGVFVIANHADELTPWAPVLSTLHSASGYLSIPCCAWDFDARYERSATTMFPIPPNPESGSAHTMDDFVTKLNLGGDGSNSSGYSMYRIWLATLGVHTGWETECDMLRIPSTRNWAIIGRRASPLVSRDEAVRNAEEIVQNVKDRAVFKPRKPEGKGDGH
ncbi:DUF1613 domain-containing protein [Rhodocollybia butyracea]|uniref:tRNA (uracil-O(2)-)-methyltransferase n=1 Tax=Rhodocollybia butyracea TaxID=206335 RepID=A0A9P5UDD7_9AGAR|nr:DUF1613 domain-containing protein [Rhodocollybia butyracea]